MQTLTQPQTFSLVLVEGGRKSWNAQKHGGTKPQTTYTPKGRTDEKHRWTDEGSGGSGEWLSLSRSILSSHTSPFRCPPSAPFLPVREAASPLFLPRVCASRYSNANILFCLFGLTRLRCTLDLLALWLLYLERTMVCFCFGRRTGN